MTKTDQPDNEGRTTALGLFNTARSYLESGVHLHAARLKVSHPQAPINFLLCHAIELYFKAFLRAEHHSLGDLRRLGHNIAKLAEVAKHERLELGEQAYETFSHVTDADVAMESRYIVTGFKTVPAIEALVEAASELDAAVGGALSSAGAPIQKRSFQKQLAGLDEDGERDIEEELEELTEREREILAYLLHHNQRMFECAMDGGYARTLISRGIVRLALQPGQVFDPENVPTEVPKQIWAILKKHRSKFPYEPADDGGHPWRVPWMLR